MPTDYMNATALIQVRIAANSNTLTAISDLTVTVAGLVIPVLIASAFILFLFCLFSVLFVFDDAKMLRHLQAGKL